MDRAPCCEGTGLKKGPWSSDEDKILLDYINHNGPGSWRAVPILAGLRRCGKSCRLRWTNYLRPDIKRGPFTQEEEQTIVLLHAIFGSRWSTIASHLPGRTDNEIKNFWNTYLKKRLLKMGLDPSTHAPRSEENKPKPNGLLRHRAQWESARLEAEARLSRETQIMSTSTASYYTNSTVEIMMPNVNSPADYFLKVWYSDAGEAFRRESSSRSNKSCNNSCDVFDPSGIGGNQVPSTEFPKSEIPTTSHPVSSLCSDFTQHCFHQSLHPNDKANDNDSQQCNFASANWITNCRVITLEANSSPAAVSIGQVKHKAPEDSHNSEELGHSGGHCTAFSEILMDFPDNNIASMITELGTSFRQHSVWPWPELHLEDDKDYCGNASIV